MADATIKEVSDFFKTGDPDRDSLKSFSGEWKQLNDESKQQLRAGIGDRSFTY